LAKEKQKIPFEELVPGVDLQALYGMNVLVAEDVRAVVKVVTDAGTFGVKRVSHKPEKLQFMYEAQEHLWQNGFTTQSRFVPTLDGRPFVDLGDELLFLTRWIDGRESNVRDPEELKEVVRLQARLHRASRGFTPTVNATIKTRWANWHERFDEQLHDIVTCYERFQHQDPQTELEHTFVETAPAMIEMAERAVQLLKQSPYTEVLHRARKDRGFVHGDFTYHNFIKTPEGEMKIIDFDYCAFELRVHDFARFMRKMLRRTNWDPATGELILRTYHEVDPLSEEELAVLHATLWLPQRYWRAVERGFLSHRYTPEGSVKKMREETRQLPLWKRYVESAFPTRL